MKNLIQLIGFQAKENAKDIFIKKYVDGYCIEIDFEKQTFHFGGKIKVYEKDIQNISKPEDWVVLECVDRLLTIGYKPENITLEKVYPAGHGFSGRLDICVSREDKSEYLLIECKTYGKEFDKEFTKIKKDGGQLFTYFKFSNKADIILLYASELNGNEIIYRNEIIKIEEDYRTGDVKDFYEKWNKLTKDNGVFDKWVKPYNFESKALTINDLEEIRQEDSSFIFNRFLEILRHNVVSDKGNAFNRIFTLFLCKIYDEKDKEDSDKELEFQWFESPFTYDGVYFEKDTHVSFQIRLTDLYKKGMKAFLEKNVTDFSKSDFNRKYNYLTEEQRAPILEEFHKIRLEKNNEFAIKDVYDKESFQDNAIVVKEIVELLQKFKIRYTKKQQYLSDFFELLLTTGLKQESGQFFTPVPVAQFIIKSLPLNVIIENKLKKGERGQYLPYVMDYAAGSGHFLTETMHEVQRIINTSEFTDLKADVKKFVKQAKEFHFDWAFDYVYGIEKDYRLVKVGKVGCYLHGDGLANVIHSDGLARFSHNDYKGVLENQDKDFPKENKQFDVIVSNPPYSVAAFKNNASKYYNQNEFDLYEKLTDSSSEIECLFIERTKQLLKDGGVAGIILPSSILSNTGIYSKSRELILKYFDIIAISELGSNTFMATGTNTVTLFLRRRNNYDCEKIKTFVSRFFIDYIDNAVQMNEQTAAIEKPITKYINHVWENISYDDYVSLLKKTPNDAIKEHEIYKEYCKKISVFSTIRILNIEIDEPKHIAIREKLIEKKEKAEKEFWKTLLEKETEKLFYFIVAYPQKVVLVKSGEKDAEKRFLGYEFSNRRGSEGIHAMQRGKNIEDCTQMFDADVFDNPTKASTYIYKAFAGDYDFPINEAMQNNVSRHSLVDMMTFDRVEFEKNISLSVKKKVKVESKWEIKKLGEISIINYGTRIVKKSEQGTIYPVYGGGGETFKSDNYNRENVFIISRFGMSPKCVRFISDKFFLNDSGLTLDTANPNTLNKDYLNQYLFLNQEMVYLSGQGVAQKNLEMETFNSLKIPLPPIDIQQKIVAEIEVLEAKGKKAKEEVEKLNENIKNIYFSSKSKFNVSTLSNEIKIIGGGTPNTNKGEYWNGNIPWLSIVDFKGGNRYVEKTEKKITEEGLKNSSTKYLDVNDIIISARGTVGALAQLKIPMTFNQSCYGIKAGSNLSADFLYFALKFEVEQFKNNAYGTIFDAITTRTFELIKIPLPSLPEQQKIVSKLEKIEEKIKVLEIEIALIPEQKETILKKYL